MYTKHNLATDIVDIFDEFLASKGVEIPCADPDEEIERRENDNYACLYGMEFWNLVDDVERLLEHRSEIND